jgi:hypothetical protein
MVPDFGEKPGINPGLFSWLDDSQALPGKRKANLNSQLAEDFHQANPLLNPTLKKRWP